MTDRNEATRPAARLLDDAAAPALGRTMARAFDTDPIWEHLVGRRFSGFAHSAVPFFTREARHHLELGGAYSVEERAGALWAPPKRWKMGLRDIAMQAPSALRLFGVRLPMALAALNETDKVHPSEPHWYLALLGTHPDHQGKGLGSAALAPVLEICDRDGTPAYLESSKEQNVPFYERHGFEVTSTLDLSKGKGPRLWLMWREPRPPESPA